MNNFLVDWLLIGTVVILSLCRIDAWLCGYKFSFFGHKDSQPPFWKRLIAIVGWPLFLLAYLSEAYRGWCGQKMIEQLRTIKIETD